MSQSKISRVTYKVENIQPSYPDPTKSSSSQNNEPIPPKKRSALRRVLVWTISPYWFKRDERDNFRLFETWHNVKEQRRAYKAYLEEEYKKSANKTFEDYVEEYGLDDRKIASLKLKYRIFTLASLAITSYLLYVAFSSIDNDMMEASAMMALSMVAYSQFSFFSFRLYQIKNRKMSSVMEWASNPLDWF